MMDTFQFFVTAVSKIFDLPREMDKWSRYKKMGAWEFNRFLFDGGQGQDQQDDKFFRVKAT